MRRQRGAFLILVTSLLLAASLMVIIGSYKGVFYQIKRSQNEIESRKAHWLAEGGLDCAFVNVLSNGRIPEDLSRCKRLLGLDELEIVTGRPHTIRASSGYVTLSKAFLLPELKIKSAITAINHLLVSGALYLSPHLGTRISKQEWACVSLRYQGELYAQSYATKPPRKAVDVSRYFSSDDKSLQPRCLEKNYTKFAWQLSSTQDDFIRQEGLEPFKEVFATARDNWYAVMTATNLFGYVPDYLASSLPVNASDLPLPQIVENCGQEIIKLVEKSHEFIWVYGGCDLISEEVIEINIAISTHLKSGLILVLHNGAVAVSGHQALNALVYHFISDASALKSAGLDKMENERLSINLIKIMGRFSSIAKIEERQVSYFQQGSFYPNGGLILDAPDHYALIDGSLDTEFKQSVTSSPARKLHPTLWVRGGWYDF
ncbi:hypothetical protein [Vibrio sp. T11.5]|uniref:hypothetical protein n=1 Tax=Vibrio sp. T11.5 TaxID=2998836 RepID=UPI0022CDA759|nr:hypothetical protein [Vibrio sp. T11.5]MDA0120773.1 hypothetical protein [Vibrio sp. T11.5]